MTYMKTVKFKTTEKNAKNSPVQDIQWEGEEIQANSKTKLEQDTGTGEAFVLRFFDFGTNLETFKQHKPTAQELFDSHRKGIEPLLWRDGLAPCSEVEPRLMFSKGKKFYRFVITCKQSKGHLLFTEPKTLSQLLFKPA